MYKTQVALYRVSGSPVSGAAPMSKHHSQRGNSKPVLKYGVTLTVVCLDSRRECSD